MAMAYLESPVTDPAWNLALEQVVFDRLPRNRSYFMLWRNDNAIIVGRHQNTLEEVNLPYVESHGIRVVRRLSGGGAVYHDLGNINYTFITDAVGGGLDLRAFCLPLVRTLARLGVDAEVSGRNDVTIGGRKCSGNAQYRREGRVMHHGTILFDSDLTVISSALRVSGEKRSSKGVASVSSRVTNVRPHLKADLDLPAFWAVLRTSMAEAQSLTDYTLSPADLAEADRLRAERYDTWDWNFGASPACTLRKERRVALCGTVQLYLSLDRGVITAVSSRGDYFGAEDARAVEQALQGVRLERAALTNALKGVDVGACYQGLSCGELIDLLLQ